MINNIFQKINLFFSDNKIIIGTTYITPSGNENMQKGMKNRSFNVYIMYT